MGYRRRHRSRSRDGGSPERTSSRSASDGQGSLQQHTATSSGGDDRSSSYHRSSSSRHHHRRDHHHGSERPRRRRERPEWLKMILRAQRQFVQAILMTVGLCLKRGAQFVSDMLLGAPVAPQIEDRSRAGPSGSGASSNIPGASSTAVATRSHAYGRSSSFDATEPTVPNKRAIVAPEELD